MNKRYRTLMVGCGAMSGGWLASVRDHFSERVEIVGLVDLNLENATRRAAEFGLDAVRVTVSLDEALADLQPEVVLNCTIPGAHLATCRQALLAGCHVLVEKPLAPSVAECAELIRVGERAGRSLAVIQNRRYEPGIVAVRQALRDGLIGPVHTLCADFFIAPHFGGFREQMESPLLLDMAIHTFDQSRRLLGLNARNVTCHEFNPPGSWFAHGASAMATFEMAGGVMFNYRGSWCAQGFATAWSGAWRAIGEKGTLVWDGGTAISAERIEGPWDGQAFLQPVTKQEIAPAPLAASETGHPGVIGEFLDSLDSGGVPQTDAADNIHSIAMVEAAIASARAGRTVSIPENLLQFP